MAKVKLTINNNKTKIECSVPLLMSLREEKVFAIREPGAFYTEAFRRRRWDGFVRYITERGIIDTGKVPQLLDILYKDGIKVKIDDQRDRIEVGKIPKDLNGTIPRPYQREVAKAIKNNLIQGLHFPRGIVDAATNAGKTVITAMIHKMYGSKTLLLLNSTELFNQSMEELPKLIPGEVGWIKANEIVWNNFMIIMVQTAKNRIPQIQGRLTEYPVLLVDECDLATSKTYQKVMNYTFNSYVKIGLSGSVFKHKDKNKNERIRCLFGDALCQISNRDLIDAGYSSKVKVFIWQGNTKYKIPGNWEAEYKLGLVESKERNKRIINRTRVHVWKDRLPILIITKLHSHVEVLYKMIEKRSNIMGHEFFGLNVDWVHHERKERHDVVKDFKEGNIDILVGSYILKRGKNFPLMQALINAGGGDSVANVLQILGRATRKHESKKGTVIDDFMDKGKYLMRHSKHRMLTYKTQRIRVEEKFDKSLLR